MGLLWSIYQVINQRLACAISDVNTGWFRGSKDQTGVHQITKQGVSCFVQSTTFVYFYD